MTDRELTGILWDYLQMHQQPQKADVIVGFGCYNEDVARRAAQLWQQGLAPVIVFTGALGRNTRDMWSESEAARFARIAMECGVPAEAIAREEQATNTGENFRFTRQLLQQRGIPVSRVIGVQKPYMERRLAAAFPVYWPGVEFTVTSPRQTLEEYLAGLHRWGRNENQTIHMMVGDLQRIWVYARRGYQIPMEVPEPVMAAWQELVSRGYRDQLVQE